jgi:hypothetical protein
MRVAGCFRGSVALVFLLAAVAAVWLFRDRIATAWYDIRGIRQTELVATPELAESAQAKIDALNDGSAARIALSAMELQSLLTYRYQGALPGFLGAPGIEIHGDELRLRVRVPVDKLPNVEGLGEAAAFLPDTTELTVAGRLLPLDTGRVAFSIDDVRAQRFPLPRRLVPGALERLGRRNEPGLPPEAMALPLPPGVAAAHVARDSLVFLARPRDDDNTN